MPGLRANFPMAIDDSGAVIAVVFRQPAKLVLLDTKTGAPAQQLDTCGDADDVFFDRKRQRIYVSCGAGAVDVFHADATGYRPLARRSPNRRRAKRSRRWWYPASARVSRSHSR